MISINYLNIKRSEPIFQSCIAICLKEGRVDLMYAKNTVPQYEGDGYLHAGPAAGVSPRVEPLHLDYVQIEQEARRLRSEALAEWLERLSGWLKLKLSRPRTTALEEYLSHSSSLADVERRLREAERDGRYFTG
jgi:hypothetical protein